MFLPNLPATHPSLYFAISVCQLNCFTSLATRMSSEFRGQLSVLKFYYCLVWMADNTEKPHKLLPLNPFLSDLRQTEKADVCGNRSACRMSSLSDGEISTAFLCFLSASVKTITADVRHNLLTASYTATLPSTQRDAVYWSCRASSMDGGKLVLVFLLSMAPLLDFSLLHYVVHSAPLAVMYKPRLA